MREITGDVIWRITQGGPKRGNEPGTVNRYLATVRNLLRTARDEWQWIEVIPKIRLLSAENERDRWLTHVEADRLIVAAPPHLKALIRLRRSSKLHQSSDRAVHRLWVSSIAFRHWPERRLTIFRRAHLMRPQLPAITRRGVEPALYS